MAEYQLHWQSSAYERYDSPMMTRALDVLRSTGLYLIESYGGTDGTTADNGLRVVATEDEARALRDRIAGAVGHDVSLTEIDRA